MKPFIELDGVSKGWNGSVGVDNMNLAVEKGTFVVLLGPSGCGKSTSLRLIAGLEAPDSGRVRIDGRDVTAEPPSRRNLSMVFQSYALFPHLTVAENIVFGLKVRRVGRRERAERLKKVLHLTGLEGLEQRKPSQLSGGQRQRVALARAVIADHPICLMDEPLSNLDAKLRHTVRQEIRALQRALGMTVIYVTHDQTEAMGMADQVVLMKDGKAEQIGSPAELYENPASAFAATFIGTPPMTLMPAENIPAALCPEPLAAVERKQLLVGVRPEHLRPSNEAHALRGIVRGVEFLGAETFLYLTVGGEDVIARLPGRVSYEPGVELGLVWSRAHALLFDCVTGMRVQTRESEMNPRDRIHLVSEQAS